MGPGSLEGSEEVFLSSNKKTLIKANMIALITIFKEKRSMSHEKPPAVAR